MKKAVDSGVFGPIVYLPSHSRLGKPSSGNLKRQAVFLDRDGTIIDDVGYLVNISNVKFLKGVEENIRLLQEKFLIIIITNQSAVARGLIEEDDLLHIHESLVYHLRARGVIIDAIYSCPHHPELGIPPYNIQCNCRKPKPGLIEKAVHDFNIELKQSYIIGDKLTDIEAGQRAKVHKTILLNSPELKFNTIQEIKPSFVVTSFKQAISIILALQYSEA